jgi:hypothetical protein
MNHYFKIKKVTSSSNESLRPPLNIKIKLKHKKNSLAKLLNDIKYVKYKYSDKNSLISSYDDHNSFFKPKTTKRSYEYYNDLPVHDNEGLFMKDINKINIKDKNKPIWNYSYYFNQNKNKNYYKYLRSSLSAKKIRIKKILNEKSPNIIEDWQKPRMIKILEKNSLIEEEIMLKPWRLFPHIEK